MTKGKAKKSIASLIHEEAARYNISTAEYQSMMEQKDKSLIQLILQAP